MGRTFGLVMVLVALAAGAYIYRRQAQSVMPSGAASPRAAVDLVAVRADLLSIASAERRHMAAEGKYVSVDELISANEVVAKGRGPCSYDVEVGSAGFRATASCTGDAPSTISTDETMQLHSE